MQRYLTQEDIDLFKEPYTARKQFLNSWFQQNRGNITDTMVKDVLKDHENHMCYHGPVGLEICWSYILKSLEKEALVCAGRPCKNEYVKIQTF